MELLSTPLQNLCYLVERFRQAELRRWVCDFQPEADQPLAEKFVIWNLFGIWDLLFGI